MTIRVLVDRLRASYPLSDADALDLETFGSNIVLHSRGEELVVQGTRAPGAGVLLSGMGYKYKLTKDGKRQVVGFICPGDIFGLEGTLNDLSDHYAVSLTSCQIGWVSHKLLAELTSDRPSVSALLWKLFILDTCIYREWLTNVGTRSALERTAHLICELYYRFLQAGRAVDGSFRWPISQALLGDALSLTSVHVNRMLQKLREQNLIGLDGRDMTVLNPSGLEELAQFDCSYLMIGGQPANENVEHCLPESGSPTA